MDGALSCVNQTHSLTIPGSRPKGRVSLGLRTLYLRIFSVRVHVRSRLFASSLTLLAAP
jgi:hypothetical protein